MRRYSMTFFVVALYFLILQACGNYPNKKLVGIDATKRFYIELKGEYQNGTELLSIEGTSGGRIIRSTSLETKNFIYLQVASSGAVSLENKINGVSSNAPELESLNLPSGSSIYLNTSCNARMEDSVTNVRFVPAGLPLERIPDELKVPYSLVEKGAYVADFWGTYNLLSANALIQGIEPNAASSGVEKLREFYRSKPEVLNRIASDYFKRVPSYVLFPNSYYGSRIFLPVRQGLWEFSSYGFGMDSLSFWFRPGFDLVEMTPRILNVLGKRITVHSPKDHYETPVNGEIDPAESFVSLKKTATASECGFQLDAKIENAEFKKTQVINGIKIVQFSMFRLRVIKWQFFKSTDSLSAPSKEMCGSLAVFDQLSKTKNPIIGYLAYRPGQSFLLQAPEDSQGVALPLDSGVR